MATTQKGIYYPDDYTAIADIPEDMKDLAESVDTALGDLEDNIEQNIQPQIDDIEEEQTTQNNNIEALQIENARLKATLPTTTGEGENITLDKTAEMEFVKPPLPRGNSEQVQYSGKNLFNRDDINATWQLTKENYQNGIKLTSTASSGVCYAKYVFPFEYTTVQNIYLNFVKNGTGFVNIYFYDENHNMIKSNPNQTAPFSLSDIPTTSKTVELFFYGDVSAVGKVTTFDNVQLELGSTATSYEPYVGGTASPNPSFPSPIQNVTGDVEVLVRDTKIFDKSTIQAGDIINNNATIRLCSRQEIWIKAGTYTFTTNITSPFRYLVGIENVGVPPLSNYPNYIYNSEWQTSSSLTFTINEPGYFTLQLSKTANAQLTVDEVMNFDYSLTAHEEQTLPLTLGTIELCKIGMAQDYFYKENNKWYLYKAIDKVDMGDLTWLYSAGRLYTNSSISLINGNEGANIIPNNILCTVYSKITPATWYAKTTQGLSVGGNGYGDSGAVLVYDSNYTNGTTFKNDMSGNYLYWGLKEPTITEITDTTLIEQLDAISNAISYDEQTNISGTSDEANPLFSVEAYQSIKLILAS